MNKQMQKILFSYVRNGIEKGVNLDNFYAQSKENNRLKFFGDYKKLQRDGYIKEDIGTMEGEVIYTEDNSSRVVAVKAIYSGSENGVPYRYNVITKFNVFDNGLVYRTSIDSRDGQLIETYYKTVKDNKLNDYITNCNTPISLYEGDHLMNKANRK